jgi:hypothetical protein
MNQDDAPAPRSGLLGRAAMLRDRAAPVVLPILLVAALAEFLYFVDYHYDIEKWLVWRYLLAWGLSLVFAAASLSTGHLVLRRLGRVLPIHEHLLTAMGIGAFVFCLGNFAFGLLHLYGKAFFVLWPLAMIAAGARPLYRYLRRATRHLLAARARSPRGSLWKLLVLAFGVIGFLMLYFVILTPDNAAYDARWKHLAVAETYAVDGGIRRFPEGWTVVTYPHLVSVLFTWCFLEPAPLFDKVELCAHLELVLFAWTTIFGIAALVRRLVPRAPAELVWPVRFLFPGVFLYDSSLSMGADHVGALWAVASYTLLLRAWADLSPATCALLAFNLAAGIQTKMTALILLLPFPIAAIVLRAGIFAIRGARGKLDPAVRKNAYLGPLAALAAGVLSTTPFWLKNWVWYGDPFYPVLYKHLHLRPWTPDAATIFEYGYGGQFWRPPRTFRGVVQTARALFDHSFYPNDWPKFHGRVPTFGSLLTFSLGALPFLKGTKRIWALVLAIQVSIGAWYWTHHQDRYLQTIVPLMAAATAAIFVLMWRTGRASRVALGGLIAGQILWAGDIYFIPTHAMIRSPIKATVDFLATGYQKHFERRERWFGSFSIVANDLPPRSRVVLHEIREHVGIGASTISDFVGWQGGISYGRLKSPRETYDLLKGMGATHLLWDTTTSKSWDTFAADIVFYDFALRYGVAPKAYGKMTLAEMPKEPPPEDARPDVVAFLGCEAKKGYKSGLYTLADMHVPVFGRDVRYPAPRTPGPSKSLSVEEMLDAATFVVLDPECHPMPDSHEPLFALAAIREGYEIVRRSGIEIWIRWDRRDPKPVARKRPPPPNTGGVVAAPGEAPGETPAPAAPSKPAAPGGEEGN